MEQYVPPKVVIKQMLLTKLELWKNTVYDAGLDAKVATVTEDDRMLQGAQKRLKSAMKAVEFLEEELNKSQSDDGGE
jgi:hypothetical protein